jgi:hypothetical protein
MMISPTFSRLVNDVHPIEVVGFLTLVGCMILSVVFRLSWFFPDGHSSLFVTKHYVVPLLFALIIAFIGRTGAKALLAFRLVVAFTLIVFLHFNLKLWAQLVNPLRWDVTYQSIDEWFSPILAVVHLLRSPWNALTTHWPYAYHDVFVGMFFVSLATHAAFNRSDRTLSEVTTTVAIILSMGGLAYFLAPALGPFIFEDGSNIEATRIQHDMAAFQGKFIASAGKSFHSGNFIMPLAAMPSLHTAHTFALFFYAWRSLRWLGWIYLPPFLFIIIEAVTAKWHYLIDIPAGLAIAGVAIWLAGAMNKNNSST